MAFFRKWLGEEFAASRTGREGEDKPLLMPEMVAVNDFFYRMTGEKPENRVELLVRLYDCYKALYAGAESLDEFIFWGDVLLGDFNDVDKYLVDPKQLFRNISDLKEIEDNYEYMTEAQLKAMNEFIRSFRVRTDRRSVSSSPNDARASFLSIWNMLQKLYDDFRESLKAAGMSYEGMVYRELAESSDIVQLARDRFPDCRGFVFVGLNVLTPCEEKVMKALKNAGLAEFCWDCGSPMLMDPLNKASMFMKRKLPGGVVTGNLVNFGQAFEPEETDDSARHVTVVSVPSSVGQAKLLPEILSEIPEDEREMDTAVVLPDEGLLIPILNTIPESVKSINVTMGYPLSSGELWAFMNDVQKLQLHMRQKAGAWHFYHKNVWDILQGGVMRSVMTEDEMEAARKLRKASKFFVPEEDFGVLGELSFIFRAVAKDPKTASSAQTGALAQYLMDVVGFVAGRMKGKPSLFLELDFAKEYWGCLAKLSKMKLEVAPATWFHLLQQFLSGVSVPFKGEPLQGLQVMGPLETRALDFKNIIIMSSNEGTFPRRSVSSSFIPPELRRGFALPTYELQDAMWAYYFYRMIARPERVWMLYDSRTEGTSTGEESRFIKQLRYHFRHSMDERVAGAAPSVPAVEESIPKTAEHIARIEKLTLSASSLHQYLECPAQFFYAKVLGLKLEDEINETMDAAALGNVWHETMRALLCGEDMMCSDRAFDKNKPEPHMKELTLDYLREWQGREADIKRRVVAFIRHEMNTVEPGGRDLIRAGVITSYVLQAISRDIEILEAAGADHFEILALEEEFKTTIDGMPFRGFIDRLDSINGRLRVCDYKSGSDNPDQIVPSADENDAARRLKVCLEGKHEGKAAVQFAIYDLMVHDDRRFAGREVTNTMYAVTDLFKHPVRVNGEDKVFVQGISEGIGKVIQEMKDPLTDFVKKGGETTCEYCDFRIICGK
ncbi:MAG: PD-(D/E)XK nuclease family protein [Bacteroidales bacterium]|nr:PD-(D/E)XK nuclease family protein [Bacteroidales bacterium]